MFIEEIKVECFKTFGVSTSLGPFIPGNNILVGLNGSGKTSIFDAIELIFNDDYVNVTNENFNKLVCHDTRKKNKNVISVEIIFDNSNKTCNDFPPKFSIKRKLSCGMDNYFYNQEKMFREKFVNLINKLDINISVIRQGEVTQFATSDDMKRLELLFKMVCYTKSSNESKQCNWNTSVATRNEIMVEVNQCYDKLKKEHLFCEEFKKILRKKELIIRAMEKKKLINTKEKMQQLEKRFIIWIERQKEDKPKYYQLKSELEILECRLTDNKNLFQELENTEKKVINTLKNLEHQKGLLEKSIRHSQQKKKERENNLEKLNEKLESLETKIASEEEIIQSMKSELSSISNYVKELEIKYRDELWEFDCLYEKLLKDHEPVSKEAKDESIHKRFEALQESIVKEREHLKHYRLEKEKKNQKVIELADKISSIKSQIKNLDTSRQSCSGELNKLRGKISIAADTSKVVTAQIEEASIKLILLQNNYKQNCKKLKSAAQCDVMYNKTAIENVLQSFNNEESEKRIDISNYHGFAIDCFECNPEVEAAVLAVKGNYLFNFVFDYGKDSTMVLNKIEDGAYLSTINLDLLTLPKEISPDVPDAFPLITQITYKPVYEKLVKFMFGNVMVCRNVEAALKLSKKKKIICVTLNGNLFFPSGALSEAGNWNENERNQIQIYRSILKQLEEIKNIENEIDKLNQQKSSFSKHISESSERRNTLESQKVPSEYRRTVLATELDTLESELRFTTINNVELKEIEYSMERNVKRIEELELKFNSNDQEEMNFEEHQRYEELKISTENLLKLRKKEKEKADELNKKITLKLDILKDTYLKEKINLQKEIHIAIASKEMMADLIENEGIELKFEVKILEKQNKKLEEVQNKIKKVEKTIKELEDTKKQTESRAFKLKLSVEANDVDMKLLEAERNEISKIIEEEQRNMKKFPDVSCRESDPELENIEKLTMQQLCSLQNTVANELRTISSNIDKNASEMFSRMHETLENAKATAKTLHKDKMRVDQTKQKYIIALKEVVYNDLVGINKHFKDIVKKFMPNSHTELILITADQEYNVDQAKDVDLDHLIGISIKFSEFEGLSAQTINELSGGQKSVIALAFFIAVQKFYPSTVILCDEIDQALDSSHRNTLCDILKEITSQSQIFVTTFRPELLETDGNFYRVEKKGTTSIIKKMNKQQAFNFLRSVNQ